MGDNILRRLRNGAPQHKKIVLGNGEDSITVVVVMLSIDEMQMINEKVEEYAHINPTKMSDSVKQQMYNKLLAYNCVITSYSIHYTKLYEDLRLLLPVF